MVEPTWQRAMQLLGPQGCILLEEYMMNAPVSASLGEKARARDSLLEARSMRLPEPQSCMLPGIRACERIVECIINMWARERGSVLEDMDHLASKVMWPLERTSERTVQGQVMTQRESQAQEPLCSPGIIFAWVWDGPGAFSK